MIWHSASVKEVLDNFGVDAESGLANGVADQRLEKYGENVVKSAQKISLIKRFLSQFQSKTVITLIIVSLISFVVSLVYQQNNPYIPLLIILIVLVNALISAFHLFSCDTTLDDIKSITNPTVNVLRDGIVKNISSAQLVPGDIILLEEGDYISADARLISSNELRCNETALTGDDVPVEKDATPVLEDIVSFENRVNMVFSGTTVVHGSAKAVVVATALNTENGKTSAILEQQGTKELPIQSELDFLGKAVNIVILVVCALVFIINLLQNFNSSNFAVTTVGVLLNTFALAFAAIPEGLPAIATIVIAIGTQRILQDKIIIKKTSALQTIGKTNVICADKTGIFTHKDMVLSKIYDGKKLLDTEIDNLDETSLIVLKLAACCSTLQNDATENAIKKANLAFNSMSEVDLNNLMPKIAQIPFDSVRKSMTVITMINERPFAIVKGAPEIVVPKCNNCNCEEILKTNEQLALDALRVVCIAMRPLDEIPANPQADEIENGLTFVGLLGLVEPLRKSVVNDIKLCKDAGIKTVMITGDNLLTAKSIATKIGVLTDDSQAITGAELENMTDEELAENIQNYSLFARVSPNDKLRIVRAWQANNAIVTVTGDSLQDAESLAAADVGCAIGQYGTDVAKGNADVIILKNNFGSIVRAIKESRGFFSNIKKAVYYLCSCNFAELLIIFLGVCIFAQPVLAAVQLVLLNLLTDCAPAISFSMERAENSVMKSKSLSSVSKILDLKAIISLLLQSLFIAVVTLVSFAIGNGQSAVVATTMAFATLGIAQALHCFNSKSVGTIFTKEVFSNSFMNKAVFLTLFITVFLVLTPVGFTFGLTILNGWQLAVSFVLALLVVPFNELLKFLRK